MMPKGINHGLWILSKTEKNITKIDQISKISCRWARTVAFIPKGLGPSQSKHNGIGKKISVMNVAMTMTIDA
jgi:hypothetical protein